MSRHSDGSRFGPYVIFLIDYPNIKSLKHRNTEKSKVSNTKDGREVTRAEVWEQKMTTALVLRLTVELSR